VRVLARAGYHTSAEVVSNGIEPAYLPAQGPEWQPTRRPWPLTDEGVADAQFADLAELE